MDKKLQYTILISGTEYKVLPILSTIDFLLLHQVQSDSLEDSKKAVGKIIYQKLDCEAGDLPSFERILQLPDNEYCRFLDILSLSSNTLRMNYLKYCCNDDRYTAMVKAMRDEEKIVDNKMAVAQKKIDDSIRKTLHAYTELSNNVFKEIASSFADLALHIQKIAKETLAVSEEEQSRLHATYLKWTDYGWTTPFDENYSFFEIEPENEQHADLIMSKYNNPACLDSIFSITKKQKGVDEKGFHEAELCFEHHYYRACCLILFSLIDGLMIHIQQVCERKSLKKVKIGQRGFGFFLGKINEEVSKDEFLYEYLQVENIFHCLFMMTQRFEDIVENSLLINRNVLIHGAMKRDVSIRDCVQLFFLYYNLLDQWELLEFE